MYTVTISTPGQENKINIVRSTMAFPIRYDLGNGINVWFQKISIPPPWRELEIPEEWGVDGLINFQMVQFNSDPT